VPDTDYDVIMAMGSLHNAPMEVMKPGTRAPETSEDRRTLLQLAYPKVRWTARSPPFDKWGSSERRLGKNV